LRRPLLTLAFGLAFLAFGLLSWRTWLAPVSAHTTVVVGPRPQVTRDTVQKVTVPGPVRRITTEAGSTILFTENAVGADGSYDAIVHFHGIYPNLEPALAESGLNAAVLIVEAGTTAGDYSRRFAVVGVFQAFLRGLDRQMSRHHGGRPVRLRRLALSAWSAGYGAIAQLLRRADDEALVSAVLLSDAPHVAFLEPETRTLCDEQLSPFVSFAKRAVRGEVVFGLTHTAIQTADYASTSEVAARLHHLLDLPPEDPAHASPELPSLVSQSSHGALVIQGYSGTDRRAHADQQRWIGRNLWPLLHRHFR